MKTLREQLSESINESKLENSTILDIKGCHCCRIFDNDVYNEYMDSNKPEDIIKILKNNGINLKDYDIISIVGVGDYEGMCSYIIAKLKAWEKYLVRYVDGDKNFDLGSQKYIVQWLDESGTSQLMRYGRPFDELVDI